MSESMEKRELALITGASSGIGRTFAVLLAREGFDLLLIGRDSDRLELAGEECRVAGARVDCFVVDLGARPELDKFLSEQRAALGRVALLVNNAAFSVHGPLLHTSEEREHALVELQCDATLRLIRSCLPGMLERGGGGILNISSLYAFLPVPYQAVYAACKSFLVSFSQALNFELRNTGVRVCVVCPGLTDTMFRKDIVGRGGRGMSAAKVAEIAWRGYMAGRCVVIPGVFNKLIWLCARILPASVMAGAVSVINSRRGLAS